MAGWTLYRAQGWPTKSWEWLAWLDVMRSFEMAVSRFGSDTIILDPDLDPTWSKSTGSELGSNLVKKYWIRTWILPGRKVPDPTRSRSSTLVGKHVGPWWSLCACINLLYVHVGSSKGHYFVTWGFFSREFFLQLVLYFVTLSQNIF